MTSNRVLIFHSDSSIRMLLGSMLQTMNLRVDEAASDRAAVRLLEQGPFGVLLAAIDPRDPEGMELLAYSRRKHPGVAVILLMPDPSADRLREAAQWGAVAIKFPSPASQLRAAVAQALGWTESGPRSGESAIPMLDSSAGRGARAHDGNGAAFLAPAARLEPNGVANGSSSLDGRFKPSAHPTGRFAGSLIGESPCFRNAVELAGSIAPTDAPLLVIGERGTGKSVLTTLVHENSPRRRGPILEVDISSLLESELADELFGTAGGSNASNRPGLIERAAGGTLVLNEVGTLPGTLQTRLWRVLREGYLEGPDGQRRPVDVRFVFTNSKDLAPAVERDRFLQELYERISVVTLRLPPLRHRGDDVLRLAVHFLQRYAQEVGRDVAGLAPDASESLLRYDWPGNVEELEHAIERAVILGRGPRLEARHIDVGRREPESILPRLSAPPRCNTRPAANILPLKEALEEPERQLILQALEALNWNRQETARVLDINRTTLYKKMKKYGLLYDEPVWVN